MSEKYYRQLEEYKREDEHRRLFEKICEESQSKKRRKEARDSEFIVRYLFTKLDAG